MLTQTTGIYKITCADTKKVYVGSAVNLYRRWYSKHLPALRKNKHYNRYLQAAWNKYGENAFTCETIETCDTATLLAREQYYMDMFFTTNPKCGYNIAPIAGSTIGVPQSQKSKNAVIAARSKTFIVRTPAGVETTIKNLSQFCITHALTSTAMNKVAVGKQRHHKRWECRPAAVSRKEWLEQIAYLPASRPQKIKNGRAWCSNCRTYIRRNNFANDQQQPSGCAAYCCDCRRTKQAKYYRARRAEK